MPPARSKKRQNEYFDPGVQGRRTGITIPENQRDSFGIENIDGIFSSPEVSSPIQAAAPIYDSPPDPSAISNRKILRSTKTSLPPPSARSTFKTNIGSSPRRRKSSLPPASQKPVTRRLDFRADEPRQSIEIPVDPELVGISTSQKKRQIISSGSRKRPRIELEDDLMPPEEASESLALVNGEYGAYDDDFEVPAQLEDVNNQLHSSPMLRKSKKARKSDVEPQANGSARLDHEVDVYDIPEDYEEELPPPPPSSSAKKPSSKGKARIISEDVQLPKSRQSSSPSRAKSKPNLKSKTKVSKAPAKTKKTTKSAKTFRAKSTATYESSEEAPDVEETDEEFVKPAKPTKKSKKPLAYKDPNASIQPHNSKSLWTQKSSKPSSSKLAITDRATSNEPILTTRSGRRTIAPIQRWRIDENIKYTWDGQIEDVRRAPSEEIEQKVVRQKSKPTRSVSKNPSLPVISETQQVELESWEEDGETLVRRVNGWDIETNLPTEEEYDAEIAHGCNSVNTKTVVGANFRYGKVLNASNFAAGILELPPGGYKSEKNSRKMHMIFFLESGKVDVILNSDEFTISKGGCFQVPKGNFYSMENPYEMEARVFFAQACQSLAG